MLALEAGVWAAAGAFSNDGPGSAIPSALRTAAPPFMGDRGEYSLSTFGHGAGSAPERRLLEFQWLPAESMRDALGVSHHANRLRVWSTAPSPFDLDIGVERGAPLDFTFAYDEAGRPFARTQRNATTETSPAGFPSAGVWATSGGKDARWTVFLDPEHASTTEPCCGLRNRLQGRAAVPLPDVSFPLFLDAAWADRSFRAVQLDTVAGHDAVRWETNGAGPWARAWTTPDVPYPLRIEIERTREPGAFDVVRLSRFERGDAPMAEGLAPTGPAAPPLEWRPIRPWGPDDEGVTHPWSLSAAYEFALANHTFPDSPIPELWAFLAAHPRAITQWASYWEQARSLAGRTFGWEITVADADASFRFTSVLETSAAIGGDPVEELTKVTQRREAYVNHQPWNAQLVPPDRAPTSAPSVASLLSRWGLHRAPADNGLIGNSWSYHLRCADEPCSGVETVMSAGARVPTRDSAQNRPSDPTETTTFSLIASGVTWAGGEALREMHGLTSRETGTLLIAPLMPSDAAPPAYARPAAISESLVPLSPLGLVAAGIAALVAGAAVAFWSALRNVWPFPLFSRLEPEAGLRHPARLRLMHEIERDPGLHFHALVRRTGMSRGAATHHLRKLVEFRSVRTVDGNGYQCFFPVGRVDSALMKASPFLKSEGARRMLAALATRPGTSGLLVAQAAGLDPGTVTFHLKRLHRVGLIDVDRSQKALQLTLTELGRAALLLAPDADRPGARESS